MAKLSYKRRKNLDTSEFAEPGKRKYPIPDKSHARNALSRVSQFGSESEKATIRRKVHSKFPDIGKGEAKKSSKKSQSYKRVSGKA